MFVGIVGSQLHECALLILIVPAVKPRLHISSDSNNSSDINNDSGSVCDSGSSGVAVIVIDEDSAILFGICCEVRVGRKMRVNQLLALKTLDLTTRKMKDM